MISVSFERSLLRLETPGLRPIRTSLLVDNSWVSYRRGSAPLNGSLVLISLMAPLEVLASSKFSSSSSTLQSADELSAGGMGDLFGNFLEVSEALLLFAETSCELYE
jgi:hypothetical protein